MLNHVKTQMLFLLATLMMLTTTLTAKELAPPYAVVNLPFVLHQIPGVPVYYVIGLSGIPDAGNEGHTSNAGFVVTDSGVVVFDALGTPALGYRLLQRIREVTDKPVERVVISHYHADHIYGLQAFKEQAGAPAVWAQHLARDYMGGNVASQGEDAERRLAQRREALFPWVTKNTYVVAPTNTFDDKMSFTLGGIDFELKHMGPAHAPGDIVMLVKNYGVLFSGDVIFKGRVPFLDSPQINTGRWLEGLDELSTLRPQPRYIIPGHGDISNDTQKAIKVTKDYISYVRRAMLKAAENFIPFDEAYEATDWSGYKNMPAFAATNRGNAYRIYLEMEANNLK